MRGYRKHGRAFHRSKIFASTIAKRKLKTNAHSSQDCLALMSKKKRYGKFDISRVLCEVLSIPEGEVKELLDDPEKLKDKSLEMNNLLACSIGKWKVAKARKVAVFHAVLGTEPRGAGYTDMNKVISLSEKKLNYISGAADRDIFLNEVAAGVEDILNLSAPNADMQVQETVSKPIAHGRNKRVVSPQSDVENPRQIPPSKTRVLTKYKFRYYTEHNHSGPDAASRKVLTTKLWRTKRKLESLQQQDIEQKKDISELKVVNFHQLWQYLLLWHVPNYKCLKDLHVLETLMS